MLIEIEKSRISRALKEIDIREIYQRAADLLSDRRIAAENRMGIALNAMSGAIIGKQGIADNLSFQFTSDFEVIAAGALFGFLMGRAASHSDRLGSIGALGIGPVLVAAGVLTNSPELSTVGLVMIPTSVITERTLHYRTVYLE